MNRNKLNLLIIFLLIPIFSIGQIPKDQFIDADPSAPRGMKLKPFIQKEKGIYHYAVLTELPFENNCDGGLSKKEKIECSENKLRSLIYQRLNSETSYKGNVYVYLTVTKEAEIVDITVNSYPKSESINNLVKGATKDIEVKPGKYNDEFVISRLWTPLTFPSSSKELFSESLIKMKQDEKPEYKNYENLIFDATEYIFSNPVYPNGKQFMSAVNIVSFWMNKDTGMGIPTFGDFFTSLTNKDKQQFLYTVAMINYGLNQKINHGRVLKCEPIEGKKYSEQDDVKEVQLEGAKILLNYIGNEKNNVPMNSKTKKYFKAFEKNELKEKFFK